MCRILRARALSRTSQRSKAHSRRACLPAAWPQSTPSSILSKAGDHVVCGNDLYGGTPRLFNQVMADFGLEFTYVDTSDANNVERAIRKNTRMVYVETPTNPLMRLSDLAAITSITRRKKVSLVVDNTFMSPYFQQPLSWGADMVVHSTTKFLNGHSDGLGGVVVCAHQQDADKLAFLQKASGAILSPFECWLVLRGVKTLAARMDIHDRSGRRVAEFLSQHRKMKSSVLSRSAGSSPAHAGQASDDRFWVDDHV